MAETPVIDTLIEALKTSRQQLAELDDDSRRIAESILAANNAFHREALAQLIRSINTSPAAATALREAVRDATVYALLRHHELIKPSQQEQIESALDEVRPALRQHGGDVELQGVVDSTVSIRFVGQCDGCNSAGVTFREGVEKTLRQRCTWITEIALIESPPSPAAPEEQPLRFVSPFADNGVGIHNPGAVQQ